MKEFYHYNTLLGDITIITSNGFLIGLKFGKENFDIEEETDLIKKTKKQVDQYLMGTRKLFNIPIKLIGTDFQVKVWKELKKIEYGKCISYQELANRVKNKDYARAVGMANNKNPILIIIPCHRVIGKGGNLLGYASGIDTKIKLLEIEQKYNK